jgi:hypothetical protein
MTNIFLDFHKNIFTMGIYRRKMQYKQGQLWADANPLPNVVHVMTKKGTIDLYSLQKCWTYVSTRSNGRI